MGLATVEELNGLAEHLGVFEQWAEVCDDFKIEMVQFLDFSTRAKLSMCSKSDYEIVRKAPIRVHHITIFDQEKTVVSDDNEPFNNVQIVVQFSSTDTNDKIDLKFWQHLTRTVIKRKNKKALIYLPNTNYYEQSVKFAESLLKKCNFKVAGITVGMANYPVSKSEIKSLPNCKNAVIHANDVAQIRWWLSKLPENLKTLKIVQEPSIRGKPLPSDLLDVPQIRNCCDSLHFSNYADFSDAQFLGLKSRDISFFFASALSADAVNRFLKAWTRGDAVDGFRKAILTTWRRTIDSEAILSGLEARRWDEAFENEQKKFWADFMVHYTLGDATYQVASRKDPLESVTVSLTEHSIKILATGKRRERDGRPYTHYSVPR